MHNGNGIMILPLVLSFWISFSWLSWFSGDDISPNAGITDFSTKIIGFCVVVVVVVVVDAVVAINGE